MLSEFEVLVTETITRTIKVTAESPARSGFFDWSVILVKRIPVKALQNKCGYVDRHSPNRRRSGQSGKST